MSKLPVSFRVYRRGDPSRVVVWCSDVFEHDLAELLKRPDKALASRLATMDELLRFFAQGETLPASKLRKERDGYAFRAGPLRFYGAFSNTERGTFVLSHPLIKNHDKLDAADLRRVLVCRDAFDRIASLNGNPV